MYKVKVNDNGRRFKIYMQPVKVYKPKIKKIKVRYVSS